MQVNPDALSLASPDHRRSRSLSIRRDVVRSAGHVYVHIGGELDVDGAPDLRRELATCLTLPGITSVIVDLTELRLIASAGIYTLLVISRLAQKEGRKFAAVRPPAQLQRVFRLSGAEGELVWLDVDDPSARPRRR